MSFLTPLYIAGLLALSLPLLFHLIRRAPRGQLSFSSLMFLRPSLPRLTRRSRLDQLLLLLLRALALCLLSLAFARPFLREAAELDVASARGRRIAVLVDASASMKRGDLWTQARVKLEETLDQLTPADRIALFTFDDQVQTLVDFEDEIGVMTDRRSALVGRRLEEVAPSWAATDVGTALVTVADALEGFNDTKELDAALEIVLISDLQKGCRLEALEAYEWPADVRITVKRVAIPPSTNAGLQLLSGVDELVSEEHHRVRVTNDADSNREQFALSWSSPSGAAPTDEPFRVYVPPGESRVVHVPRPEADFETDRLVVSGDDHDFDNTFYFTPPRREDVTVEYIGLDAADDPEGLRYYLERAFATSRRHNVSVVSRSPEELVDVSAPPDSQGSPPPRLVVVTEPVSAATESRLRRYMESGGTLLYVLKDATAARSLESVAGRDASGRDGLRAREATVADYAMLGEIDFAHPVFASLSDPRFNDFTKIHFWKHRQVEIDAGSAPRVLARFDDGDPALFEERHGRGRLLVLTSGWHPADSQLALSSKFVPLLSGMLERTGEGGLERPYFDVHDHVPLPRTARTDGAPADRNVHKPDGSEVKLATDARTFDATDQPGIYRIDSAAMQRRFAVNIPPSESETAPLSIEDLERHGVRLGREAEETDARQQLRDLELESRQKIWRWLIAGALGILILETWLAGRLALPARGTQKVER